MSWVRNPRLILCPRGPFPIRLLWRGEFLIIINAESVILVPIQSNHRLEMVLAHPNFVKVRVRVSHGIRLAFVLQLSTTQLLKLLDSLLALGLWPSETRLSFDCSLGRLVLVSDGHQRSASLHRLH
jgi:hypothetical protein